MPVEERHVLIVEQAGHEIGMTEMPAPAEEPLVIDDAVAWQPGGRDAHRPADHARPTRQAKSVGDGAIGGHPAKRDAGYDAIHAGEEGRATTAD